MSDSSGKPDENKSVPYGEALLQAVKELKDHPPLLVVVALGILLVAVAALGPANARDIVLALVAIDALGVAAWLAVEAGRIRRSRRPKPEIEGGRLTAGPFAQIGKEADIDRGDIQLSGVKPDEVGRVKGGDIHLGPGSRLEGKVRGGDIKIEVGGKNKKK